MKALCAGEDLRLVGGEEGRAHLTREAEEERERHWTETESWTGGRREGGRRPRIPGLKTTIGL